jgi:signal transduction histidine kinase
MWSAVGVGTLIEEVVASLKDRLASMKVAIEIEDEDLVLSCDRQLMVMLLTQYIDNACKYSIFGTTITIRAGRRGGGDLFRAQFRAGDSHGRPRAHLRPLLSFLDLLQPRPRHGNRPFRGQARGADSWRLCVGHQRREEGTTFFAAIPLTTEKESS